MLKKALKQKNNTWIIILLLLATIVIRLIPIDFPKFTEEETRVAERGYTLAKYGTDELGRKFPLIFNSLEDYKLPVTSYLTMMGIIFFGKTDFGVRVPFILIGTLLVLVTFSVAKSFNVKFSFRIISAFIVATSPSLIFLSKTPNETIVLIFIFMFLFYLLVNNKDFWFIVMTMLVAVLVSKLTWFILLPFTFYIIWLFKLEFKSKKNIFLLSLGIIIVTSAVILFLAIPQAKRSLWENNFSLFSDITVKNGIDRLRGQGMQEGWPNIIDKLLFNKMHFLTVGLMHWLSLLNPALYFGQFDGNGLRGFSYLGTWVKILIIPAFLGLISAVKEKERRNKFYLLIFPILTWPALFVYPQISLDLAAVTLPFMAIIIAIGCITLINHKKLALLGFFLIIFELSINLLNISAEYKNTNTIRPGWIRPVIADVFKAAKDRQISVSDDIVSDITPFINWYTDQTTESNLNITWPYKFRQYNLPNIQIIPSEVKFRLCKLDEKISLFVSKRDLNKILPESNVKITTIYKDYLQEEQAFLITDGVCLN